MKVSFSTLGCPEWTWDDMLATAKDLGFDGIEVRGIENELYVPNAKPFTSALIQATKERLKSLDLEIPAITSSCYLFDKQNNDFYLNEGKEYIDLAQRLGVPYVRVLGDKNPEPGENIDIDFVSGKLAALAEHASGKNVEVLIETNGIFARTETMLKLLQRLPNPNIGVLWDVHHPFRYMKEPVEETYNSLKKYIKHVHVKDSVVENGKVRYRMTGYGDIPIKKAISILKNDGFTGYVSLEWVKRWCIDLEEPGIVFSHFINYMREVMK